MKDVELRQVFGTNLKRILREKRVTQTALAEKVGITVEQVSRWVTCKSPPGWNAICLISEILEVNVGDLFCVAQPNINFSAQPLFKDHIEVGLDEVEYKRFKQFRQFEKIFTAVI